MMDVHSRLESLLESAETVIRPVGAYLLTQRVSGDMVETKGLNSLVSHVDKTAEAQLVEGLGSVLPEAGFLAEEGTAGSRDDVRYRWVVDPLDGTTNLILVCLCFVFRWPLWMATNPYSRLSMTRTGMNASRRSRGAERG